MNRAAYDVAIVGAGIVGAACALECARAGMKVALIENAVIGGGATAAGMGHVVVMDDSEAQFALTHYSRQLWQELSPELSADVEYVRTGTIWVAADEEEMAEVRRKHDYYGARGVRTEIMGAAALRSAEPKLRHGLAGGLLVPDDVVLYAPCAARWLLQQAQSRKAQLCVGQAAELSGQGVTMSDGSFIAAGMVVNAAGHWSTTLTPGIEVRMRKGHLVITDRYPGWVHHQLVELGYLKSAHSMTTESVAFNVQPRITGQLLIGSSRQFGVEDKTVDTHMLRAMVARASEYMPELGNLSVIRTWTGFRAATPDKLPLIGPVEDHKGLYLATGHEGLGITTSLGTAKLLVAQLTGEQPAIPFAPYLPSRNMETAHA